MNNVFANVGAYRVNVVYLCSQVSGCKLMEAEKQRFPCERCDRQFKRRHDLHRHDTAVHLQVKAVCHLCDLPLSSRGALKRHLKRFHGTSRRGENRPNVKGPRPPPSILLTPEVRTSPATESRSRRVRWEPEAGTEPRYVPAVSTGPSPSLINPYDGVSRLVPFEMLRSTSPVNIEGRIPTVRPPAVRMSNYTPSEAEQISLRVRMEVWVRRIARETTELDEHEYLRKYGDQDADLGFFGEQTVRHLIRLHNRILITRPSEVAKDPAIPKVSDPPMKRSREATTKHCTVGRATGKHFQRTWNFPPRASATVTSETANCEEQTAREAVAKPRIEDDVISAEEIGSVVGEPPEKHVEPIHELNLVRGSLPSQLLEEDPESTGIPSLPLEVLVDESTMQFQALSLPADEPPEYNEATDPFSAMDVESNELIQEVSEYLCAPNLEIEGCFAFDLEEVVGTCDDEL